MKQGTVAYAKHEQLVAEARAYKAQGHSHKEVAERFGKSEQWSQTWCKGISPQTYLRGNQYTSGNFDRIENAKRIIEKYHPEYEYVGGFTNCDSPVVVRCKTCGAERTVSMITLRRSGIIVCRECKQHRKRIESNARAFKTVAHSFNKGEQVAMRFCPGCGALLAPRKRLCHECAREHERHRWSLKKRKRNSLAYTKESHTISLRQLYERDGGVCWICGKPCDYSAHYNDSAYPSVDHVVPISKGGKDEWDNIKLAHRGCNSSRGNKTHTPVIAK